MKKLGLLLVGVIAVVILLANAGSLIAFIITGAILYYSARQLLKSESMIAKIAWVIILLIALSATLSNLPAAIGLVAVYILYLVYQKWNDNKNHVQEKSEDPFMNFEKQWSEMNQ